MKKTLFSLAFLAASGGYVAFANHGLDSILPTAAKPEETAALPAVGATLKAPISPVVLDPAPKAPAVIIALASPAAVSTPTVVAPAQPIALAAPVSAAASTPPLPRPRPVDAPTIESARTATPVPTSKGVYRDGTYSGTSENAYYGRVQVQVTVAVSQIVSVEVLDYPSDRRTSRYINSQALPMLQQEVMQTQSANVDTVSGATLTSEAYVRSLDNALRKAASGNA